MPAVADIVKIDAPLSAPAGEYAIVDVSLKNISGSVQYLSVTATFDSTSLEFQFDYLLMFPGETFIFRGWFTMPNKNVRVTARGLYRDGSKWVHDDTAYIDISLREVYIGAISRKELEYDHAQSSIPVY